MIIDVVESKLKTFLKKIWSRFDYLRSLGQAQEKRTLRNRIADLSHEALATYGGEPHALDCDNYGDPFQHQVPNTGRKYRYTTWK